MIHFPILRWGEPYKSLEVDKVFHHATGEQMAEVSQANAGIIARDMRHAERARAVLREIPCKDLLEMCRKAGDLFINATLPAGEAAAPIRVDIVKFGDRGHAGKTSVTISDEIGGSADLSAYLAHEWLGRFHTGGRFAGGRANLTAAS